MGHGTPDWWGSEPSETIFQTQDAGELAVRLGSIDVFDRRGNVIWLTNFGDGLQGCTPTVDHTDSKWALTANRAFSGAYSLKLDPRGAADAYAEWGRVLHFLNPTRLGFETVISLDTDPASVRWSMWYFDGTNRVYSAVWYYPATGDWKILKADGNVVTVLAGAKLQQGPAAWHHVKMVIDVETEKYAFLLIDKNEVNLSAYALKKDASADLGQLLVTVTCAGSVDASEAIFVGGVIITQNEP